MLLAFGQLGANAAGRVKSADTRCGGAHPLGQGSLGNQLSFDLVVVVHQDKGRDLGRMGGGGKGANHLSHLAGLNQRTDVDLVVHGARVIGNA